MIYLQQRTTKIFINFVPRWDSAQGVFHPNWVEDLMYAFPVPLVPQVILKLKLDHAKLTLIVLAWLRQ